MNVWWRFRRMHAPRVRNRQTGSMEPTHAGHFCLCIGDLRGIDRLLRLKNCIDALGRDNRLAFVLKNERRILSIKYNNIDLVAEGTQTVHDVSGRSLVAFW